MSLEQPVVPKTAAFDRSGLMPGDILLMRSQGQLSSLIAWFGDSIYSHAGMVGNDGTVLDATTHGVQKNPLSARFDNDQVLFIDACRPLRYDLLPLTNEDRQLVVEHGEGLVGTPYAMDDLFMVGVLVAVRDKSLPVDDVRLRWLLHEALDHVINDNASKMICSEFVFRCFSENAAIPTGMLAPQIVLSPPNDAPFPKVDWLALLKELWPLLRPGRQAALAAAGVQPEAAFPPGLLQAQALTDDDFATQKATARATLGLPEPVATAQGGSVLAWVPFPNPNPKMVTPHDLEMTPSHFVLGRVKPQASLAP
ncbi:hypothetical protein ACFOLC_14345 [Lysobacter cavernae]|uniref:FHA domain-containing protein n=1 Tax=Lysobacter cavernae TaxID=1685901 RepID=A0ABV7RU69_9GAMM